MAGRVWDDVSESTFHSQADVVLLPESRIPVGEKDRQRIWETYPMFHVANVRIWKSWCVPNREDGSWASRRARKTLWSVHRTMKMPSGLKASNGWERMLSSIEEEIWWTGAACGRPTWRKTLVCRHRAWACRGTHLETVILQRLWDGLQAFEPRAQPHPVVLVYRKLFIWTQSQFFEHVNSKVALNTRWLIWEIRLSKSTEKIYQSQNFEPLQKSKRDPVQVHRKSALMTNRWDTGTGRNSKREERHEIWKPA